jgi:DNA-binding MarR family transcriptional regulator
MQDLDRALADIVAIRSQIARGTAFRGVGAATLAGTGGLALACAVGQALWLGDPMARPGLFFGLWIAAALAAFLMIGIEAVRRSRRLHSGLADAMVWNAIEVFLPAAGAGACLALVIARFAPGEVWMLPACSPRRASCPGRYRRSAPGICSPASSSWRSRRGRMPCRPGRWACPSWSAKCGWRRSSTTARDPAMTTTDRDDGRFSYEGLDRIIHERARLSVLTSLVAHPKGLPFPDLKRLCGLTDGNLSRHLAVLSEADLVSLEKGFAHNRPQTVCRLTAIGRQRFIGYLGVLEQVVRDAATAADRGAESGRRGLDPAAKPA